MQVRVATAADAAELARLLHLHASAEQRAAYELDAFATDVSGWMAQRSESHVPFLAVGPDGRAVGMAWLAMQPRAPRPGRTDRVTADVQSVFVEERHRGAGIGTALLDAVLEHARRAGAERATVHSGRRALSLYARAGFAPSQRLMLLPLEERR